jgi:DEAD/DEAH box helicase domain-containing protein
MMSEPRDLGRAVGDGDAEWFAVVGAGGRGQLRTLEGKVVDPQAQAQFRPAVFLYDNYPGGVGLSAPLYDHRRAVVRQAMELIGDCDCLYGCPACVGPILVSDERRGYSPKQAALGVVKLFASDD